MKIWLEVLTSNKLCQAKLFGWFRGFGLVPRERTQVRTSPQYLHFSFVLVTRLKLVGSHGFSSSHVQMASRREVLYREFTMASRREEMCAPHTYSVSLLCAHVRPIHTASLSSAFPSSHVQMASRRAHGHAHSLRAHGHAHSLSGTAWWLVCRRMCALADEKRWDADVLDVLRTHTLPCSYVRVAND